MSRRNQNRQNKGNQNQNKEKTMSENTQTEPKAEQINMEALKTKDAPAEATQEGEEKPGVFSTFIIEPAKKIWNGTAVPLWAAGKTLVLEGVDAIKRAGEEIKREYESQGFVRFCLNKVGKGAVLLAKVGVVVTVAMLLNNYLMMNFGFSILSVNAILISLGVAALCFAIVSYMNQKDTENSFSFKNIGADIAHSFAQAA